MGLRGVHCTSLMINFDLVSRNVPNPKAFSDIKDKRLELKKLKIRDKALLNL